MTAGSTVVLLVEDDPADVMLMREALKRTRGLIDLRVVNDGIDALACLRGEGRYAGGGKPALVLLDWRLPRMGGEEVLKAIRGDAALKLIPVLVLTTSNSDRDVRGAYALGANCFLTKPTGLESLTEIVSLIESLWLVYATLSPSP